MDLSRCPAIQAAADCLAEKLLDPTVIEYEFERLWAASSGPEASNEISRSQDNAAKNRYVNVLPFDRNRICLAGTATGDYINASLITGDPAESESLALSQSIGSPRKISSASSQASSPSSSSHQVGSSSQQSSALGLSTPTQRPNSPPTSPPKTSPSRAYIATQGPLPTTTADFWQMVQEQGTAVIVMLTRHIEDASVPKCASYYPAKVGDSQTFGNFTVAVQAAEDYGTDIRRRRCVLKQHLFPSYSTVFPVCPVPLSSEQPLLFRCCCCCCQVVAASWHKLCNVFPVVFLGMSTFERAMLSAAYRGMQMGSDLIGTGP